MHLHTRPLSVYLLISLHITVGLIGTSLGILLLIDPSGALVGFTNQVLRPAPFHDFLLPGLVILYVLGLLPLATARGLISNEAWSLPLSLALSILLVGLAVLSAIFTGINNPLFQIALVSGIGTLLLSTWRSIWHYALQ